MIAPLTPSRVAVAMVGAALAITAANAVAQVLLHGAGYDHLFGFGWLVDVDREQNLATWFATVQLVTVASLLAAIATVSRAAGRPHVRAWSALAVLFFLLSIDEATQVHEIANQARDLLGTGGYLFLPWVIGGALLAATVAIGSLGLLRSLPRATAGLVLLAGGVFVAGAAGVELFQAAALETATAPTGRIAALAAIEEAMEMAGLAIFAYALGRHLERTFPGARLGIAAAGRPARY